MLKTIIPNIVFFSFLITLFWIGCVSMKAPPPPEAKEPDYLQTTTPSGTIAQGVYHTVKRGETLWRIAKTYEVTLQTLAELNNIDDPAQIKVNQIIFIPGATQTKTIILDTTETPASSPRIIKIKEEFIWPVQGEIVSPFGIHDGLRYEGIDIAAPLGTPVRAACDGEVVYEGRLKGYGNLLILKHEDHFKTVYAYNHVNLVPLGRRVKKGETIAKVGNTGRSPDPRLHFQVRDNEQARNPLFFLP